MFVVYTNHNAELVFGPFPTAEAAEAWANKNHDGVGFDWWSVLPCNDPDTYFNEVSI